jgi:CheY-like chemotaxis protein
MLPATRASSNYDTACRMPILNGFQATERVRELEREGKLPEGTPRASHELNGRIPIFVVSASLKEDQKDRMTDLGLDGWVLKPVDFKRLAILLEGITDPAQRAQEIYSTSRDWERGGWLTRPKKAARDFATEPDIPATPSEPAAPSQSAAPSSHEGSS